MRSVDADGVLYAFIALSMGKHAVTAEQIGPDRRGGGSEAHC